MTTEELIATLATLPETKRMPALFIGHGSPMNGIEDNVFSRDWARLGKELPRPTAILSISAHWLSRGTEVHMSEHPRTIHDFWGFPKELYDLTYPALGAPVYGKALQETVTMTKVQSDFDWGLDHGTWIVLKQMYPFADVPVLQLSIDMTKSHEYHYKLGKELALLRRRGVLIMGSGNLVHNLREVDFNNQANIFSWAKDFDEQARGLIEKRDHRALMNYEKLGSAAQLAIPTPDHYWPLLYILGLQEEDEGATFPIEGITHGSISMRSVLIGK
jgi:4,5-DOPA dioxygenase extradiol